MAVLQNIPCPPVYVFFALFMPSFFRFVEPQQDSKGNPLARECVTGDFPRVYIALVPVFQKVVLPMFTAEEGKNVGCPL